MTTWTLPTVLAVSAAVIREHGWLSCKEAYQQGRIEDSTGSIVESILNGERPCPTITEADCRRADAVLPWLRSRDDLTTFDKGLRERLSEFERTGVPEMSVAYVSSAIMALKDGTEHYANRDRWKSIKDSRPVGKPGSQIRNLCVTVIKKVSIAQTRTPSGRIREVFVYSFRDSDGNAYKWKTDKNDWLVNDELTIKSARISHHSEYQGYWFTELKNCRTEK